MTNILFQSKHFLPMRKFYVLLIAITAIFMTSCNSNSEKKVSDDCSCDTCKCDTCMCTTQAEDSATVKDDAEEEGVIGAVNGALNKTQTKANASRKGACFQGGCSCKRYVDACTGGKCVCGHWDYVHKEL